MSTFIELRDKIQNKKIELLQKQEQLFVAKMALERYQQEITEKGKKEKPSKSSDKKENISSKPAKSKTLAQKFDLHSGPIKGDPIGGPTKVDFKLVQLTQAKNKFLGEITAIESELFSLYQLFWALAIPQDMVENWEAKYPIILLPIRIETRFLTYDGDPKKYLGVRFIPDDIFVDTHEKLLTADEYGAGTRYWGKIGDPENERLTNQKKEWRVLNSLYGSNRAAYIVLKTRPLNFPMDINGVIPSELQYPPFTLSKESSWSLPARSYVVPDKFVVRLQNGADVMERESNHVHAYPLILGPDPNSEEDLFEELEVDGQVELKMDERIRWLYDFEAAVANGMAIKIEISNAQFNTGFDKVTALGLRLSADQNHSQQLLEELIDSHHYGQNGFSIVPQGTPTNNSKDKPSGYSQLRQDAEISFNTELGNPLIDSLDFANKSTWKDGQWLAHGLGVSTKVLEHIYYANYSDRIEATSMNVALWHATLGYYVKHMLVTWNTLQNDTLSSSDVDKLQTYFINYVSGRGPMPAVRVSNQPYGVLPVSAFSKMELQESDQLPYKLNNVLRFFRESWRTKIDKVKTMGQGSDNWQQDFLDILGLHSGSVEYFNRLTLGPLLYYMYLKQTPNNADVWIDNQVIQSNQTNANINNLVADADLLLKNTRASMLTWFPFQNKIKIGTITEDPISENHSLSKEYIVHLSNPNNIDLIIQEYLQQQNFDDSLLYLLLRHSFLMLIWEVLWKKFHGTEWIENELLNVEKDEECKAIWYKYENTKGEEKKSLITYIKNSELYINFISSLRNLMIDNKSIPTERLERLLSEHLDLCSYRFDAWQTSLVEYKLQKMRMNQPTGCYLGAYGWLLNVRRNPPRTEVPNNEIPTLFSNVNQNNKLTYEDGNAGFIHAPSIAQATTSAVLREGYLSKGKEQMQVDISSKRIRLAMEIIEGLQNGQELGALLGYRFERSLHDKSGDGLELDKYIYMLREKFPLVTRKENDDMKNFEANNVVHGLNLLTKYRKGELNLSFITDTDEIDAVLNSCIELDGIIDAISDLTMAEGVHQAVLGNHVRANALLNAIGEGKNIPSPEFIETPRTGIVLTQRLGILFNSTTTDQPIWAANRTPRAKASPIINKWIASFIGNANKIKCNVTYSSVTNPDNIESINISLIELDIEPIDLVIIANNPLNDLSSEISQRILYQLRKNNNLSKNNSVKINYESRGGFDDDDKTFIEVLGLCRSIYKVMNESGVMLPQHLNKGSDQSANNESEMEIEDISIDFQDIIDDLNALNFDIPNPDLDSIQEVLFRASLIGIQSMIPTDPNGVDPEAVSDLKRRVEYAKKELSSRNVQINEIMIKYENTNNQISFNDKIELIKIKVGKEVPILPKFKLSNYNEMKLTYEDKNVLIRHADSDLVIDDWLTGVSKVRERVQNWQIVSLLGSISGSSVDTELSPLQLPYQIGDQWMGIEYSEEKLPMIAPETLSLVLNFPFDFPSSGTNYVCGIIIDEWIEKIPNNKETTGIAFNYREPQTEAPQSILICVPPTNAPKWKWQDLTDTLDETLETAMMRAIDPDILEKTAGGEFNKFLPGIVHAISTDHKQTVVLQQPK